MTVRTNQLAAVELSNSTLTTIYTTPAGTRTIVKTIQVRNTTGSGVAVTFQVWESGSRKSYFVVWLGAFNASGDNAFLEPWLVLEPGQQLRVSAGSGGAVILASGAELVL
jgi:hypothetical protein